jgi:UDP-N-acetylglucosamine 1-carboxyvinyltransferase
MEALVIYGGKPLAGTVEIGGAKNAVLPILAATVRHGAKYTLHNCPPIADVQLAGEIIGLLGGTVQRQGSTLQVDTRDLTGWEIPASLMERMRASVLFLGAILARFGKAHLTLPGGCPLGRRPIDLHLEVMSQLGAAVTMQDGEIRCAVDRFHGGSICFPFPSVGATENFLLAATACDGETTLYNAAREPEIVDMAAFLTAMGAQIRGAGTEVITVTGGRALHGAVHRVVPDRIETATYLCACAGCGGSITLTGTNGSLIAPVLQALRQAGCVVEEGQNLLSIEASGRLCAVPEIMTAPYPGFPTDVQAPFMAAMLRAQGETAVTETVFDSRFAHVEQLRRFGAEIRCAGPTARIRGREVLYPAVVEGSDLRGTAALILAGLQAEGKSTVFGLKHLDRGYANMEEKLRLLGADTFRKQIDRL